MSAAPTIGHQRADGSTGLNSLTIKVCELYERDGLSTRRIADVLRISRQQVDRALRETGVAVAARGAAGIVPRPAYRGPTAWLRYYGRDTTTSV